MGRTCKDHRGIQAVGMTPDWGLPWFTLGLWRWMKWNNRKFNLPTSHFADLSHIRTITCPVSNLSLTNLGICYTMSLCYTIVLDIGHWVHLVGHRHSGGTECTVIHSPDESGHFKIGKDLVLQCAAMLSNVHSLPHLAAISSAFVDRELFKTTHKALALPTPKPVS